MALSKNRISKTSPLLAHPGTLASLTKPCIHASQAPMGHPWASPGNNATSGFMLHVPNLLCLNPHQNCSTTPQKPRHSPFTLSYTYNCLILLNLFFSLAMVQNIYSVSKNVFGIQSFIYCVFKRFYLFIFRERGRKGDKHICVREISIGPQLGTEPAMEACTLMGNQTRDLLVYRVTPNPLSYTSQGHSLLIKYFFFFFFNLFIVI